MSESLDVTVVIDMDVLNKAFLIMEDSSDHRFENNGHQYLLTKKELAKIGKDFKRFIDFKKLGIPNDIPYFNSKEYKKLCDEYTNIVYTPVEKKKVDNKEQELDVEKLLRIGIKLNDQIEGIKILPELIEQIRNEIMEVQTNDLSDNINSILLEFKKLLNSGATIEEYKKLKTELDLIIKKSYISTINNYPFDNKGIYLVKENNKVRILSSYNINNFRCGYIYSPNSIISVTNSNDNSFISFYSIKDDNYEIKLNEDRPIGVYAVTYGEGYINPNYQKAKSTLDQYGLEFVEIDKTKYLDSRDVDKKELIDNLLVDRGTPVANADDDYYKKFDSFYNKFMTLKGGKYDESGIITLFEDSFNIIRNQMWVDLDYLLNPSHDLELLKQVLENNIYYEFNIFITGKKVTMESLDLFINTFYEKRNDPILNSIYFGISDIINMIYKSSAKKKQEIIDAINASPCRDSYWICNLIERMNSKTSKTNIVESTKAKITKLESREEHINSIYELLKSKDGVSR